MVLKALETAPYRLVTFFSLEAAAYLWSNCEQETGSAVNDGIVAMTLQSCKSFCTVFFANQFLLQRGEYLYRFETQPL